jgi:hypothetical protein
LIWSKDCDLTLSSLTIKIFLTWYFPYIYTHTLVKILSHLKLYIRSNGLMIIEISLPFPITLKNLQGSIRFLKLSNKFKLRSCLVYSWYSCKIRLSNHKIWSNPRYFHARLWITSLSTLTRVASFKNQN